MKDLLQHAFQFRKNMEFQHAVNIYQPMWNENSQLLNDWDGWSYGFCLLKLKKYHEALQICRILYLRYPQSEILNNLYAQAIFHSQFKMKYNEVSLPVLRKAALAIIKLSPPTRDFSFTPPAVFALVRRLMQCNPVDWVEVEKWLNCMDPDLLSDQSFSFIADNRKNVETASSKEEWYSHMIRVKALRNQSRDVLNLIQTARKQNLKWHYNNDIWFARKEAFARLSLGEREKSEQILRNIIRQKKDWFLLYDLAQVVKNPKEKLELFARAALSSGKTEHKVKLYQSFYEELKKTAHPKAKLHLFLAIAVRNHKNWAVTNDLGNYLANEKSTAADVPEVQKLLDQLQNFWQQIINQNTKLCKGEVVNLLPNCNAGFLKHGKNSYYFACGKFKSMIAVGLQVEFELQDGYDKKKNKSVKKAIIRNILN